MPNSYRNWVFEFSDTWEVIIRNAEIYRKMDFCAQTLFARGLTFQDAPNLWRIYWECVWERIGTYCLLSDYYALG